MQKRHGCVVGVWCFPARKTDEHRTANKDKWGRNVVVRLEHSHSFIDSCYNHSTASGPASCRRRRPPGNAVSGHSSTVCLVVWWLSPQGQAGDAITPHR